MKNDYLARLERAARWQLEPDEAADVAADYRELLSGDTRSPEQLCRELGTPEQAVKLLADFKSYRRWLAVFGGLALCLLLPVLSPLSGLDGLWRFFTVFLGRLPVFPAFLVLGTGLSLFWFKRYGRRAEEKLPRGIAVCLGAELVFLVLTWCIWGYLINFTRSVSDVPEDGLRFITFLVRSFLTWGPLVPGVLGLWGLVKARLDGRQWQAVYILGLAAALTALSVFQVLIDMSLDPSFLFRRYTWRLVFLTALGLVGTGVGLC